MATQGCDIYEDAATSVMLQTGASAVLLVVVDGMRGHGVSMRVDGNGVSPAALLGALREIVEDLERRFASPS